MLVIKDFATTTLASALTAVATTITVANGSKFPVLAAGDYFYVVLQDFYDRNLVEVVKVTGVSGNVLTAVRGQDGTVGRAFAVGAYAELRLTVRTFAEFIAQSNVGNLAWGVAAASVVAQPNKGYLVNAAGLTITLPSAPVSGQTVGVGDYNSSNHSVTIARNGSNIMGRAENFIFNLENANVVFVYIDATFGWMLSQGFGESQAPYAVFNKLHRTNVLGQKTFPFASTAANTVDVYYNGWKLDPASDYTTTTIEVTLAVPVASADDVIEIYGWNQALVLSAAGITYDNAKTGIDAGTMQEAIDIACSFKQSGTGTVSRLVQDKLRENVSLADFLGFVGDGVADDTAAVIAASINVNLTRRKLTCTSDKTIKLVGNSQITFYYSVDLGGATLDLSGFTGTINFSRPTAPVEYLPGSAVVEALKTEANLTGKYFSGWANTNEIKDAFVQIDTTQPFYNYLGTDYARTEINHSTRHGVMVSPLMFPLPTSMITKVTVFKNEPRIAVIGGFNLLLGAMPQANMINISHSHVRLHRIGLVQSDVVQVTNPVIMNAAQCLDIEIDDVVTNWPSLTATTGAYIFAAWRCYNIRFIDCVGDGDGWGAVGTSACQRISFRRCNLSRVDSHHPFMERMDILDGCKLGVHGITASGIGDLNISDTEFDFDLWPSMDNSITSFIRSRTDVGGLMAGDLNINRCKFKNHGSGTLQFLVAQLNTSGGVPAGSPVPYQFFDSINIDGISFDSVTEINIFPKLQQNSGCKMPSKISYSNVSGANLVCWEQALSGLTPAFASVTSQVNNVALRGRPNMNLSLRDVMLSRKGISLAESDATQDWLFAITIDNLLQQSGETVYPEVELYVGGEVTIDGSIIEGLDFFLGAFSTKPIHVTMNGGAIRHSATYNTTLLNGFNGFQKVNLNGVHLYGVTAASLQSSYAATLNGCLWFLNDAPYSPELTPDMAGVAGTYTLTNKDASLRNRYEIALGTGSAISKFPISLPGAGGGTYVQTSQASAVTITRSSDGTAITTSFTGTPYVRSIALV